MEIPNQFIEPGDLRQPQAPLRVNPWIFLSRLAQHAGKSADTVTRDCETPTLQDIEEYRKTACSSSSVSRFFPAHEADPSAEPYWNRVARLLQSSHLHE